MFVGDVWAEDHQDVQIVDDSGLVLARSRLPEGLDGVTRPHALIGEHTTGCVGRPGSGRRGGHGEGRD